MNARPLVLSLLGSHAMRMRWTAVATMWVCACGSTQDVVVSSQALRANAGCAQSLDLHLKTLGARWGEGFELWALTPRPLRLAVQVKAGRLPLIDDEHPRDVVPTRGGVGAWGPVNGRCVGGPIGPASDGAGRGGSGRGAAFGGPVASASAPELVVIDTRATPPGAAVRVTSMMMGSSPCDGDPPFAAGGDLSIHLWSDEPNDLSGVVFFLVQKRTELTVSEKEYRADQKQECSELLAEASKPSEPAAPREPRPPTPTPPPAAKVEIIPPRPSLDVEWIPGYWRASVSVYGGWAWLDGHWGPHAAAVVSAPPPAVIIVPPRPRVIVVVPTR